MAIIKFISQSVKETQEIAELFINRFVGRRPLNKQKAGVIALEGGLGSGKTAFIQGFARALGIKENVLSPTFVLMKIYKVRRRVTDVGRQFKHLIHLDCYRLDSPKDLLYLGFKDLLKDKDAVILIEWADRVRKLIPRDAVWIKFKHGRSSHERIVKIFNFQ